jgi:hypothetical protein
MLVNNIANSKEEEPRSPTYLGEGMMKKNDKKETMPIVKKCIKYKMTDANEKKKTMPIAKKCIKDKMTNTSEEKKTTPWATPRSKIGSNDVNMTPLEIGFAQYIRCH